MACWLSFGGCRSGTGERERANMASNGDADDRVEINARDLNEIVWVPQWLRGAGQMSWLLVGLALLLVGIIWLLALTNVIVLPVLTAGIVAAVASPLVAWMQGHRIPRALGTALLMLAIIAVAVGMTLVVVGGIVGEATSAESSLSDAQDKIVGWAEDLGIDSGAAESARDHASSATTDSVTALLHGVAGGLSALSSLVFFLAMTALSLFFLLKDGPTIRAWGERHLGVPLDVATDDQPACARLASRLFPRDDDRRRVQRGRGRDRRLDPRGAADRNDRRCHLHRRLHPLHRCLGRGSVAVLMALGGAGPDAAAGMIVLQLLANSILQQFVQPFAMGAALGLHPLAVLIVTIAGGALFGTIGLILAAPLTSAVVKISADLARARTGATPAIGEPGPGGAAAA